MRVGAEQHWECQVDRDQNRVELRRLDACLTMIEDALEGDEEVMSAALALRLQPVVPEVRAGMLNTDALEVVFKMQEAYLPAGQDASVLAGTVVMVPMRPASDGSSGGMQWPVLEDWDEPLEEAEARGLTDRIRMATRFLCLLLLEAHARRAWIALGYSTWEQYVHSEFSISRSRSYELVDQARVIQCVRATAGMSGIPDISAYAAQQVKPRLAELNAMVRERTAGLAEEELGPVISRVVRELRDRIAAERSATAGTEPCQVLALPRALAGKPESGDGHLRRFLDAVASLASMPPADTTMDAILHGAADHIGDIEGALDWLSTFVTFWRTRRPAESAQPLTVLEARS
jgi:hypothetical protein